MDQNFQNININMAINKIGWIRNDIWPSIGTNKINSLLLADTKMLFLKLQNFVNKIGWIRNDICPSICTNKITTLLMIPSCYSQNFWDRLYGTVSTVKYWSWPSRCSKLLRWTLLDSVCCSDIEIMSFSCNLILVFVTSGYWWVSDD